MPFNRDAYVWIFLQDPSGFIKYWFKFRFNVCLVEVEVNPPQNNPFSLCGWRRRWGWRGWWWRGRRWGWRRWRGRGFFFGEDVAKNSSYDCTDARANACGFSTLFIILAYAYPSRSADARTDKRTSYRVVPAP
jgi:hypothetical protein